MSNKKEKQPDLLIQIKKTTPENVTRDLTQAIYRAGYEPVIKMNNDSFLISVYLASSSNIELLANLLADVVKRYKNTFEDDRLRVFFQLEYLAIGLMRFISDSLDENVLEISAFSLLFKSLPVESHQSDSPQTVVPAGEVALV